MTQKALHRIAQSFALLLCLTVPRLATGAYLQSPCPDIFTYQVDPSNNQIFGYIEINNVQVGQVAKLNVDLSIGTQLPSQNVGSITLVKSRDATFNDIVRGLPAQYRVNFPLQNILPSVLNIALNGQTICSGYRAQGQIVTTINLEHTLYTQLQGGGQSGFPVQQMQPQQPYQPPQQTNQWYNMFDSQTSPPQTIRPTRPRTTTAPYRPPPRTTTPPYRPPPQPVRTTVAPPRPSSTQTKYVCGRPSSAFLNRLSINGELVDKGQFPWIAPLFDRKQPRSPKYICGSTIITSRFLLTAAHCVYDGEEFMPAQRIVAVPGMYNIDNFLDENAKIVAIDKIIASDEYIQDDDLNDADVAVLKLKIGLQWTDFIIPICPWQGENEISRIVGQEGVVAGWGITETGTTNVPTFIKTVIVDRRQCAINLQRMYPANARILCGDGRGSAPCNGDSGNGLVIKRGNQYYLRGVVSKGLVDQNTLKCDVTKYAIYTDIAPFRFWLKEVTQS